MYSIVNNTMEVIQYIYIYIYTYYLYILYRKDRAECQIFAVLSLEKGYNFLYVLVCIIMYNTNTLCYITEYTIM